MHWMRVLGVARLGDISVSDLPLFIARERGFLAWHGITAHLTLVTNGSTMPAASPGRPRQRR